MTRVMRRAKKSTNVRILAVMVAATLLGSTPVVAGQPSVINDGLSYAARLAAESSLREGAALITKGRWEDARRAFVRAVTFNPDLALAHYNLGVALGALGRIHEALDALP